MRLGLEPDSRSSGLLQKLQIIPSSQSSPMSGALASCSQSLSRMEGFHIQVPSQSKFQTHKQRKKPTITRLLHVQYLKGPYHAKTSQDAG